MGRSLTFNARIVKDVESTPPSVARALGVDEHTALLLDINNGDVQTVGVGTAYLCESHASPAVCEPKKPLTYSNLQCTRLDAKSRDTFSFATWKGKNTVAYPSNIVNGVITNLPYGPV
jgi:cyanophycinase-like exopeptidase